MLSKDIIRPDIHWATTSAILDGMDNRYVSSEEDSVSQQQPASLTRAEKIGALLPPRRQRPWLRVALIVAIISVAGGAGGITYLRYFRERPAKPQTAVTETKKTNRHDATTISAETPTETFSSSVLNLSIGYPKDWTVHDNGSTATISSPQYSLSTAAGTQTGSIVITLQSKQSSLPVFKTGNAMAARDSIKLSYTQPSSVQRAQTYLSFLHYPASTTPNDVADALYITGDAGYTKGQAIPQIDVVRSDPLVSVVFTGCSDTSCSSQTNLNISSDQWDVQGFSSTLTAVLTSLVVH